MKYLDKINMALEKDGVIGTEPETYICGVPIWHAPETMKVDNTVFASVRNICICNSVGGDAIVPAILYDNSFKKLSKTAKLYVIAHEIGHVRNKDMDKEMDINAYRFVCAYGVPKMEFLADLRAVKRLGWKKTIKGMVEVANANPASSMQLIRRAFAVAIYCKIHHVEDTATA